MIENLELITKARDVLGQRQLSIECTVGSVGAAVLTKNGKVYVGVNIDAGCGIGFCAEHTAIAQMLTHGESQIVKVVALSEDGKFLPPCGRCRELMFQIDRRNLAAEILLSGSTSVRLEEIFPHRWQDLW